MTESELAQAIDLQNQKKFINGLFDVVAQQMNAATKFDTEYREKIIATLSAIRADIDYRFGNL